MTLLLALLFTQAPTHARIVDVEFDHAGYVQPNRILWLAQTKLPPRAETTGAYVFARRGGDLLLGLHRERGWDVPGGHVERGQTARGAAVREAREETGRRVGNLKLIAVQQIQLLGEKPADYAYPYPISFQTFFVGDVLRDGRFKRDEDMIDARYFPCEEALERLPWVRHRANLRAYVLAKVREIPAANIQAK